jgi:hypothetical protein
MGVLKLGLLLSQNFGCPYLFQIKFVLRMKMQYFITLENIFPRVNIMVESNLIWPLLSRALWLGVKFPIWLLPLLLIIIHANGFKWTIQRHFKHLRFKTFLMVAWGPNFMFFYLSNQGFEHLQLSYEYNSQNGSALGSHWASSLALSPICESVFHT